MKITNLIKPFLFVMLISIASSCSILKPSYEKQIEKQEKEEQKALDEAYEKLKAEHMARQSARTKQQMAITKMKSDYYNQSKKRDGFFKRIFGKRSKQRSPKRN